MIQKPNAQESRLELVSRLIRKLVRGISTSKNEKTLQSFEHQALSILRNHRSISINRYEVKRKLDDLKEKLVVDNLKEYADHLERLCNVVLNDPICLKHYEVDIQWSLLELLFSLAYNPTKALRRNSHKIVIESPQETQGDKFAQQEEVYFKTILKEDFITIQNFGENSDLSDWSGSEPESEKGNDSTKTTLKASPKNIRLEPSVKLAPHLPALQPPSKLNHYQLIEDTPNLRDRLKKSVQSNFSENKERYVAISNRMEGNFAILLSDYIKNCCDNLEDFREPHTAAEFLLLREILWLFCLPQNCKYFSIASGEAKLKKNFTVPSISAPTLAQYLENNILPYATQMNSLRLSLSYIYDCSDRKLPKTFEYYTANLKRLVDLILDKLVGLEERIVRQADFEIYTLITLESSLKSLFQKLEIIHSIHEAVVLDYRKYPPHITSAFLLSGLISFSNAATKPTESNLAISLFLTSIKAFCDILDCWWKEGRLDDWEDEFLATCNSDHSISARLYHEDSESEFYVPKFISKIIVENRFMRLMQEHSMEAGYTINLLNETCHIGDLRSACGVVGENLYDVLVEDVFHQVRSIVSENGSDHIDCNSKTVPHDAVVQKASTESNCENLASEYDSNHIDSDPKTDLSNSVVHRDSMGSSYENLGTNDDLLLLLFASTENETKNANDRDICDRINSLHSNSQRENTLQMFNELEKYKQILPLEECILNSFGRILRKRISIANKFVVDLYREHFEILRHLRNIRKVLLLAASDVMEQFYSKLFQQMESRQSWANAFVLTMQLDATISSKYPDMSSLFRLEINSIAHAHTQKVTEAVEALTIHYAFSNELSKIITEEDMKIYNEVFRFLLKVKWGLTTLENLKFSRERRRSVYAQLRIGDFFMRRLEQLRFWMFYGVQCVHSHLMMQVLQAMATQLDEKILQCRNVREMETVHKSYLNTMYEHCFLKDNMSRIKFGIEQMLNLVFILRSEWWSCLKYLEHYAPLSVEITDEVKDLEVGDYAIKAQIESLESLELTYIRCHHYLAHMLNDEVYIYQKSFLSGLSAAFNTSLPY